MRTEEFIKSYLIEAIVVIETIKLIGAIEVIYFFIRKLIVHCAKIIHFFNMKIVVC